MAAFGQSMVESMDQSRMEWFSLTSSFQAGFLCLFPTYSQGPKGPLGGWEGASAGFCLGRLAGGWAPKKCCECCNICDPSK